VYRPSLLSRLFRWSAAVAALYLVLLGLSFVAGHVLTVAGPFLAVAGLGYAAFFVVRRGRDQ
jgi:cytochrome b subunit of formate dehydrogenase